MSTLSSHPKPPTNRPLDDGVRQGTDHWRQINGVSFCHWDRWLLRLALDEAQGLRAIVATFEDRARTRRGGTDHVAEAMLAQLVDLKSRLIAIGRAPKDVLDETERASTWLYKKAARRVLDASTIRQTEAMIKTPRYVLATRAREGHWAVFPVSPAPYFARLRAIGGEGYADYRTAGLVVDLLEIEGERMLAGG